MDHQLYALLTRDGAKELPRRAALIHGDIFELCFAPEGAVECHILSKICEVVRESRDEAVYSRDIMVLLQQCLYKNDEKAWVALSEDVMTGLIGYEDIREYFKNRLDDAACFVWRFQDARSMVHSACILNVFSECIGCFPPDAAAVFTQNLQSNFLEAYVLHCKSLPSQPRALALETLGSLFVNASYFDVLARSVVDVLETSLHADDMLTVLMASPRASERFIHVVGSREDAVSRFIRLVLKTPMPRRAPYLTALAYIAFPEDASALQHIVLNSLSTSGSDTVFLAAVKLVRALESPDHVSGILARALLDPK